ncbi:uncharacterized protein BO97DRAFT_460823, partial [Aspergillus homomorphus CBS 101889]
MESARAMMCPDDNRFEDSHGTQKFTDVAENQEAKTRGWNVLDKVNDEAGPKCSITQIAVFYGVQPSQIEEAFPYKPLQEGILALSAHLPGYYAAQDKSHLRPDVDDVALQATWSNVYATTPIFRRR